MQGWASIDTVRCDRCAIFTPTDDLRFATDGSTYCERCGPPVVAPAPAARPPTMALRRLRLPRSPLAIAAAICAAIFVAFVTVAELAS